MKLNQSGVWYDLQCMWINLIWSFPCNAQILGILVCMNGGMRDYVSPKTCRKSISFRRRHFYWLWSSDWGISSPTPVGFVSTLSFLSQWSNEWFTPNRSMDVQPYKSWKILEMAILLCIDDDCRKANSHLLFISDEKRYMKNIYFFRKKIFVMNF